MPQNGQPEQAELPDPTVLASHDQGAVECDDPLANLPKPTPNVVSPGYICNC